MLDTKPDNDLFNILRDDKLSKSDFLSHLPKYLDEIEIKKKIDRICSAHVEPVNEEIETTKMNLDQKFVQLRNDMDMPTVYKRIDQKADRAASESHFDSH